MSPAFLAMLEILRTTASNIKSLGPAGAIGPWDCYSVWLSEVQKAISLAETELDRS